jgi:hypothetical protein
MGNSTGLTETIMKALESLPAERLKELDTLRDALHRMQAQISKMEDLVNEMDARTRGSAYLGR